MKSIIQTIILSCSIILWGCDTPPKMMTFSIQKAYRVSESKESSSSIYREKAEQVLSEVADQYSLIEVDPNKYRNAFVAYQENTKYNPLSIKAYEGDQGLEIDLSDFNAGAFPSHKLFDGVAQSLQEKLESKFGETNVSSSGWSLR